MSEHGGKAEGAAAPAAKAEDPVQALAKQIFTELAGRIYGADGGGAGKGPDPKELGKLSLRLADAFMQAYAEVNAAILEAERKRQSFSADDLDIDSLLKKK
jgi:hypothetical protein